MAIRRTRLAAAFVAATASLLVLAGCSSTEESVPASDALAVTDQWVKAAPEGMTAMFGTLTNNSDAEIRVVSGSTDVAEKVELHEVTDGVMKEKTDGYAIPAHGSLALAPGAEHIMLMGLKQPITAGQNVVVELRLSDGTTQTVTALARDFAGNQEDYGPTEHEHP